MFSLRDLRFVLCSRDLDVQKRAKDHRLFYLNYPEINEVGKPIDVDTTLGRIKKWKEQEKLSRTAKYEIFSIEI